jgi:dienelactone hydrolase
MSGILGITVLLGLLLLDHNQDTTLPTPTGPFAVGRTTCVWNDAQVDRLAPPPGSSRELLVWIWYPAAPGQPGQAVDDYLPAPWRKAIESQSGVLLREFITRDLSRVHAHSIRDADVAPQQNPYPVVLMRTGGAALTTDYTALAEDLASHGYVVVGFDAPFRTWVVVLPDGRVIARAPQNHLDLVSGPQADERANTLVQAWTADTGFALDQLERLNASDPSGKFLGRLDVQRVGVFGHSLGGATALLFCHDDSRCKAGIDVDGAPLGSVIAEGVTQPFMFLLSDHRGESTDAETPEAIRQAGANIRSIYDRLPSGRRLQITILGANHYMFSDGALLKSPFAMRAMRTLGIWRLDGRRQVSVTAHCISSFFDVYLKGAPASELKGLSEHPEIEFVP